MNKMLEFYRMRFGKGVRPQGDGFNGPCPCCGGEAGKSDRFIVWPDRREKIGYTCEQNAITGIYWCRQCGITGDSISYFEKCENMSFKEALQELGICETPITYNRRRCAPTKQAEKTEYIPKDKAQPQAKWQEYATKIVEEGKASIWDFKEAQKWLNARGIDGQAIIKYELGFLKGENGKQGRYRPRQSLGLEAKVKNDGQKTNRLFIPRGIVIPSFSADHEITSIRIRRPKADTVTTVNNYTPPKYMELEGSSNAPMCLLPKSLTNLVPFVVVESELDAILCHYATDGELGAIALRSNRNKPCATSHALLKNCSRIIFAMDYEESQAGIAGIDFWEETYANLYRWPTPVGKDVGEAFVDLGHTGIKEWLALALPLSFSFSKGFQSTNRETIADKSGNSGNFGQNDGHLDTSASGVIFWGGGGKALIEALRRCLDFWQEFTCVSFRYTEYGQLKRFFYFGSEPHFNEDALIRFENYMRNTPIIMDWWKEHEDKVISITEMNVELCDLENNCKTE